MSRNMMMMMAAGVDIWAALFLVQLLRPEPAWEASVTMQSKNRPDAVSSEEEPLSIWISSKGMGIWPDCSRNMTIEELQAQVKRVAKERGEPIPLRLLCDPTLEIRHWSKVAVKLSADVRQVHIAPLPDSAPATSPVYSGALRRPGESGQNEQKSLQPQERIR